MERDRTGATALSGDDSLAGRRIAVVGASRGIGRVVAAHLSARGATLVLIARDAVRLAAVRAELGAAHETLPLDVRDASAWSNAGHQLDRVPVDGLVVAAGVLGPIGPLGSYSIEAFRETLDTNVTGSLLAIMACLDGLAQTNGSVVTFSGGGATSPLPRFTAYATSKAAVVRMTENLAVELRARGVRLNTIAPGFVVSDIHQATLAAGAELVGSDYYNRTIRTIEAGGDPPERAAELTAFLLSHAAHDISGKLLSAIWDPWDSPEFQRRLAAEPDLATLRRIDDQFFSVTGGAKT
jgi:NAD(P)-dependent dehydrogenase (short-subunit alcohol dehydrogenase family)